MKLNEKTTRRLMRISLWLKSILAVIEIIGGLIFYFVSQKFIVYFVYLITQDELSEDPHDFISQYLVSSSHQLFPSVQHFIATYLLFHGVIKILVIIGLLKNKIWSYPLAIFVFLSFIIYQLYRFYFIHSPMLLVLTVFDIIVLWLVWREYLFVKSKRT